MANEFSFRIARIRCAPTLSLVSMTSEDTETSRPRFNSFSYVCHLTWGACSGASDWSDAILVIPRAWVQISTINLSNLKWSDSKCSYPLIYNHHFLLQFFWQQPHYHNSTFCTRSLLIHSWHRHYMITVTMAKPEAKRRSTNLDYKADNCDL